MHHSIIFLAILLILATVSSQYLNTTGCPKCLEGHCPKSSSHCPSGLVEDLCGCCPQGVCAKIEGEECYNASLVPPPPLETKKYGLCGKNLNCLYKTHFKDWDIPHASCVCDDTRMVCSSDNTTYNSICEMHLQFQKNNSDEIYVKNYGPCIAIPVITNGPKDKIVNDGESIILSCETHGYPIPTITWDFIPKDKSSGLKRLPADSPHIAVQARGGPADFMTTGWVQIMKVRTSDEGVYTCIAINDLGNTKISARVSMRKIKDEV